MALQKKIVFMLEYDSNKFCSFITPYISSMDVISEKIQTISFLNLYKFFLLDHLYNISVFFLRSIMRWSHLRQNLIMGLYKYILQRKVVYIFVLLW